MLRCSAAIALQTLVEQQNLAVCDWQKKQLISLNQDGGSWKVTMGHTIFAHHLLLLLCDKITNYQCQRSYLPLRCTSSVGTPTDPQIPPCSKTTRRGLTAPSERIHSQQLKFFFIMSCARLNIIKITESTQNQTDIRGDYPSRTMILQILAICRRQ